MYKFLLLFCVFLVGCNQNRTSPKNDNQPSENFIKSSEIIGSTNFGTFENGSSKLVTLRIKNLGDENLSGPATISGNDFSLIYQAGCTPLRPNLTCTLKISFNSKDKTPGIYNSQLILDNQSFELSAEVLGLPPVQAIESISFNPSSLDFGSISQSGSVVKSVYLKNTSNVAINKVVSLNNNNYTVISDACSNKPLSPGVNCLIRISLSGAGKSGLISSILSFGNLSTTLSLTGQVTSPAPSDIRVYSDNVEINSLLNFGLLNQNSSVVKTLTVRNIGGSSGPLNISVTGNPNYSLSYSNCSSNLNPSSSCVLKVSLTAPISTSNSFSTFSDPATPVTATLEITTSKNITLQGEISSESPPSSYEFLDGTTVVSSVTYPEIAHNGSLFKTIFIKNTGSINLEGSPELQISSGSGFTIFFSNCSIIRPGQSCQIRLGIVGFGTTPGSKQNVLKFGNLLLPVSGSIAFPPINCPIGQEAQQGVCRDIVVLSKISIGTAHSCSLDGNKRLRCWGANYFGQLGNNSLIDSAFVQPVLGPLFNQPVDQVLASGNNTCALAAGKVYCWGYGYFGGVGNGSQNDTLIPVEISNQSVFNGRPIVQLVGGGTGTNRICALDSLGGAICWGSGPFGPRPTPVDINSQPFNGFGFNGLLSGKSIDQFFLDWYKFGAIVDGVGYVWGSNFIGDGINTSSFLPTLLGNQNGFINQNVQQISFGDSGANSCLLAAGRVYCWGNNSNGEIGDGIIITTYNPTLAPKETNLFAITGKLATQISVGTNFACALVDGKVYCWGKNSQGQLGDGTTTTRYQPVLVGIGSSMEGKVVINLYSSGSSSCASTTEGKTYCWGWNVNGELGIGVKGFSNMFRTMPTETVLAP